jgi:hypothetical protein
MNKMVKIVTLIALMAIFAFSQEASSSEAKTRYGARAGFNLYNLSVDNASGIDIGLGFGGGVGGVMKKPLASSLTYSQEVSILWRELYSMKAETFPGMGYEVVVSGIALSVVPMVDISPVSSVPFYIAAGFQLDFDISTEAELKNNTTGYPNTVVSGDMENLFGIVLGFGYYINENIAADLRCVFFLNDVVGGGSFSQYGIGVNYFF